MPILIALLSLLSASAEPAIPEPQRPVRHTVAMPQFGRSHCTVPDVDGDGIDDVLVGESVERFSADSERASGAVYLLSGATGRGLQRFAPPAEVLHFGSSIAAVPPALSSRFADAVVVSQAQGSRTAIRIDFLDLRKGLRSELSILLDVAKPGGTSRALFLPNSPGMQAELLIRHNRAPEGASLLFVSLESGTIVREIPVGGPGFASAETMEIFEPSDASGSALLLCGSPAFDEEAALGLVEVIRLRDAKIIHTRSSGRPPGRRGRWRRAPRHPCPPAGLPRGAGIR